ncbi:MAG: DUF2304 domain-containing protein [Bacteroidia bacterium]|nr:DUF2304 domain-containing protein [Bacteroidia bacterium]
METIQIIAIAVSILFLTYIAYLIIKGKLREEYSISWIVCTLILVIFSFWRNGLEVFANLLGVKDPPNLVFTGVIFVILIYLLHLSVVVSKLQKQNKILSQELALKKEKEKEEEKKKD